MGFCVEERWKGMGWDWKRHGRWCGSGKPACATYRLAGAKLEQNRVVMLPALSMQKLYSDDCQPIFIFLS
jgi:hypothetical protein